MKIDRDLYLHSRCHIFALALHEVTGYPIKALWDAEPFYDDADEGPPALVHMWVESPSGRKLDASGRLKEKDLEAEFGDINEPDYVDENMSTVKAAMKDGALSKPKHGELEKLKQYISSHSEKYYIES